MSGDNREEITAVSDSIMGRMIGVPGVREVRSSNGIAYAAVKVAPDVMQASRLGQTNLGTEATLAMRYSAGVPVATVWEGDYSIPVVLKAPTADRSTVADLRDETMPVMTVASAPLRQFADVDAEWNPAKLSDRNGIPTITIIAEVERDNNVLNRTSAVWDAIKDVPTPEGVSVERGGEYENTQELMPEIGLALVMAVAIIFFILLFHYGQAGVAGILLASLLLCIPGAGIGMVIDGTVISLTCVLGIVSLMGILVRNAIVLLDYAEELRNKGLALKDAVFQASQRRMRPIFLTSAAATMGVVPMVLGNSALWQPMGVIIFWGTPITMIFILTTIPVAYWKMKAHEKGANAPLPEPLETHLV